MNISSVNLPNISKKTFDIVKKTFDDKYRGHWKPTEDNMDIFLNIYIKEKYKEDLFFLEYFSLYAINIPSQKGYKVLVRDSRLPTGSIRPDITRQTVKTILIPYIEAYKKSTKPFHFYDIKIIAENSKLKEIEYHSASVIYSQVDNTVDFFNTIRYEFNIKAFNEQFKIFFQEIYGKDVKIKYTKKCYRLSFLEFYSKCENIYNNTKFYIEGPCVIWTLWFLDMRLRNKHLNHLEVLDKALYYFENKAKDREICKVIRNYGMFVDKIIKQYTLKIDAKNKNIKIIYKDTPKNNRIIGMILTALSILVLSGIAYKNLKNNFDRDNNEYGSI